MGMDFRDELQAMGHEARTFAYRRDNPLYKNRSTKATYQLFILRRLERACVAYRPDLVLVIKGGPVTPGLVRRVKARIDTRFLNFFPDNPLWMIPFECIEAYDAFFTKERYALRALQQAGLRNLHYLPMYCVPEMHHPIEPTAEETRRYASPLSFVGSAYAYRERFVRELAGTPLKLWGAGWDRVEAPEVRAMVAGGPVWGRAKLAVYSGSTVSLNHHHPMNDIVGVNTRAFELAASAACQLVDDKEELGHLFTPGQEALVYRDRRSCAAVSPITWPIPTRRATSASAPASAPSPSTRCATASRRCWRSSVEPGRRLARDRPPLHRVRVGVPARVSPGVRGLPRAPRAGLRLGGPAARGAVPPRGARPLALRAGAPDRGPRASGDAGRGRQSPARVSRPRSSPRSAAAPGEVRGLEPDRHREGPLLTHRGGGGAPVRLPRHLGGELRECGLVDRGLLCPRGAALADLRLRPHLRPQAPAHDRHRDRSGPLPGRVRRPHHPVGPVRRGAPLLRLRRVAERLQARGQEDPRLRDRRAVRLAGPRRGGGPGRGRRDVHRDPPGLRGDGAPGMDPAAPPHGGGAGHPGRRHRARLARAAAARAGDDRLHGGGGARGGQPGAEGRVGATHPEGERRPRG